MHSHSAEEIESVETKKCALCGAVKALQEFHRWSLSSDGRRAQCKECRRRSSAEYYDRNKETIKKRVALYKMLNRDRINQWERARNKRHATRKAARTAVANAVKSGRLFVGCCEMCGAVPSVVNGRQIIEAHHHKGYDIKNWLTFRWLCRVCHIAEDRKIRRAYLN